MTAITLDLHSIVDLTDEQFTSSAKRDPDKLERNPKGN